tara:strand:+ start:1342 stop:1464 length:123 start_codon:yes stop_codon:yes gene_type:complete
VIGFFGILTIQIQTQGTQVRTGSSSLIQKNDIGYGKEHRL